MLIIAASFDFIDGLLDSQWAIFLYMNQTPMTTDSFKLTTTYQRTTQTYMSLINLASHSLEDSRTIARAFYEYCEHRDEGRLAKALKPLRSKYLKRERRVA